MARSGLSRWASFLFTACVVGVLPACGLGPKPTTGASSARAEEAVTVGGPFEPRTLRVHPLTRIDVDPATGDRRIEVFLELLDRWNHGVKALGVVMLELYETGGPSAGPRSGARQVRLWKVDLTDPDANAEPYDRVTRTYHLSLADVPAGLPGERDLQLRVRFTTQSGHQLETTHDLGAR